jgi:hypothetical protein
LTVGMMALPITNVIQTLVMPTPSRLKSKAEFALKLIHSIYRENLGKLKCRLDYYIMGLNRVS